MEHLTTGEDHPVSRHIVSLRTRRPQNAPANAIDKARQANIVGVVRAYGAVANVPQSVAVRKVVDAAATAGIELTTEQVRAWDKRAGTLAEKYATHLVGLAASDPEKVLALGATHIAALSGVPKVPTANT